VAAALEAGRAAVRAAVTSWACVPWRILINGVPLAYVADGGQTAALLRTARRSACIPFDVAVEENPHRRTVSVTGDPGGLRRPLLRLDWDHASGNPLGGVLDALAATAGLPSEALWRDLRRRGAVEYLSKHEEENMTVLESPCEEGVMAWGVTSAQDLPRTHTHCEVHPSMALGAVAASLHFCTFDQSCRSTYFTANKKQVSAAMAPDLTGNAGMKAWYAQAPYTTTWSGSLRRFPPCSVNLLVGVLPLESQNEEDSLVVNADTVARGALHVSMINGFSEDCSAAAQYAHLSRPAGGSSSLLAVTPSGVPRRTPLDTPLGLAPPMSHLRPGDVLIVNSLAGEAGQGGAPSLADDAQTTMDDDGLAAAGPVGGDDDADMGGGHLEDGGGVPGAAPAPARMQGVRDKSALVPAGLGPVEVRDAYVVRGRDNKRLHHSTVVSVRSLAVADKLSSSHGQKGVDGALIPARYMPVTADGQALDIIVNTHAFPSRMTPGQFVEAIAGYACAVTGTTVDATPFNGVDLKALQDKLGGRGPGDPAVGATVSPTCQHVLYSGVTGKRMQGTVFVGVVSYFRLKQMVVDKHHARAQGPNDAKTGGPMDGRAKEGGLRFGEMERDCVQGAGAANVALDRLQYQSDVFLWPVCRMCGKGAMNAAPPGLTAASFNAHAPYCNRCGVPGTVTRVVAPYATKLLFAELSAMGVRVAMDVEEEAHVNPFASCAVGLPRSVPRERKACVPRSQGPPTYRDPTTGKFDATPEAARDRMLGLLAAGPSLAQTPSRAASDACGPAPQDDADEHMDGPDVVPGAAHTPPSPSQAATQDDQCPDDAAVEDGPPRFAVPPLESALPTRNWAFCRQRQPRGSSLWDDVDALLPPSNLDETTECNSCTTVVKPASRAPRKPRVPAKKRATAR
jgi:DNA-directed RNA polymerase beta subunit